MKQLDLDNLKISHESLKNIFAYCQFHEDKTKPNLRIQKTGEYKGSWICFACGVRGKLTDEELEQISDMPIEERPLIKLDYTQYTRGNTAEYPKLSKAWNISLNTVRNLRTGWDKHKKTFTFPMFDSDINLIGIQKRTLYGAKWCEDGSDLGIFIPLFPFRQTGIYYITEGVSDLSVIIEFGLKGIARPNWTLCNDIVKEFIEKYIFDKIIIVADNDEKGIEGALELKNLLGDAKIIIPQYKDLREFYNNDRENVLEFLNV